MIKVLIVDDSETDTAILKSILQKSDKIQIIGYAKNGQEALKLVPLLKPDLITMDIQMPYINGYEATRQIMSQYPTPIVVISSMLNDAIINPTFLALEAGALTVIEKPVNILSPDFSKTSQHIIDTVLSMAEIKMIKKRFHFEKKAVKSSFSSKIEQKPDHYSLVAIGTSAGGPQALKEIFSKLPAEFPIPILVVQHMTPGFINAFTQWLNVNVPFSVKTAENNEVLRKGVIYFAPDNFHLEVKNMQNNIVAKLTKGKPNSVFCPSINALMKSVAHECGKNAIGVLLTGMGSDGAQGLLELKNAGGHTIIQDKKSAIVYGLAGVAESLNAMTKIVELENMADYLVNITRLYPL